MPVDADPLAGVGVVVVTFRSAATIVDCLAALPRDRLAAVVCVDNGSDDGTPELVHAKAGPRVQVVEQPNVGFGGGCNTGMAALPAEARLVLFLNPDAVITAPDLERLAGYLSEHPRCAMVAPRLFRDGVALHSSGRLPSLVTEIRPLLPRALGRLLPARRHDPTYATTGPVGYVEGACMLVRRNVLEQIGGFDERYFLFFEEMDLARRLGRLSATVDLCADARAEHAVAQSRATLPHSATPHPVRSELRYLRQWHGRTAARVYLATARVSWWARARTGRLARDERAALVAATRDAATR